MPGAAKVLPATGIVRCLLQVELAGPQNEVNAMLVQKYNAPRNGLILLNNI